MKPNFALSLSFDGIRLLHRVSGGWHLVGEAAIDTEDLAGELAMLRRTAQALDPSGLRTKVLIPNDQIKYLALENPRATEAECLAILDGATPYALDELAVDISRDTRKTYVAAVARETLDEALDFARQHRFQPVSFAAVPDGQGFVGEVFFGAADAQVAVERDSEAVRVVGTVKLPKPEPVEEGQASGSEAPKASQAKPAPTKEPEPSKAEPNKAEPKKTEPKKTEPERTEPEKAKPKEAEPAKAEAMSTTASSTKPEEPTPEAPVFSSQAKPLRAASDVPVAVRPAPAAPLREQGGEPVFASRTRQEPPVTKPDGKKPGAMPPLPSALKSASASLDPADDLDDTDDLDAAKAAKPKADKAEIRSILAVGAAPAKAGSNDQPGRRSPLAKVAEAEADETATAFGAPKSRPTASGRYLWLILTAILLVFLVAVGIWASVTDTALSRLLFGPGQATTEVAAADPAADAPELAAPSISEEELADLADIADLPPDGAPPPDESAPQDPASQEAGTADTGAAEAASLPAIPTQTILSPAEAERIYAATGVWQRAPRLPLTPRTESSDDIFLAAIDPSIRGSDAVALPDPLISRRDAPLEAQALPPPPGTVYLRDSDGFILATAEGTLLPSGILVYAGKPGLLPPSRPFSPAEAEPVAGEAPAPETMALAEAPPASDPALAGKRPRARPGALAETIERASLGGRTLDELAGLRPKVRPAGLVVEVPTDAIAEALASANADPFLDATELAVASSIHPAARPRNFDRVVAAEQSRPAPATAPAIVQGSSGPVPRSVAQAATVDNALALRELALIGLMGPANDRRAMIRTSSGRILLVRVGDELDGGRVTSISDTALTYTKRGRTYTLEMPAG